MPANGYVAGFYRNKTDVMKPGRRLKETGAVMKPMKQFPLTAMLMVGILLSYCPDGFAKTLHFKVAGGGDDKVAFTSDAPVEVIHGTTNQVTGDVVLDDSF